MEQEKELLLGRKIAESNQEMIEKVTSIKKIDAGFRNTVLEVNEKFILKICTNPVLENFMQTEANFYQTHQGKTFL